MADFIMPHLANDGAPPVLPMNQAPKFIMPHEVDAAEAAAKLQTPEAKALADKSILGRGYAGAAQRTEDIGQGLKQRAGMAGNVPIDLINWGAHKLGLTERPTANEVRGGASAIPEYLPRNQWPQEVAAESRRDNPNRTAINRDPVASVGSAFPDLALSLLARKPTVLAGATTGAGIEGLTRPLTDPTWGNVLTDTGKGALYGGAGSALVNTALSGAGRALNAPQGTAWNPTYARRQKLFEDAGVQGSLGDITQSPSVLAAEDMAKIIPFSGRKGFLANQAQQLETRMKGTPERIAGGVPSGSKEDIGYTLVQSIKDKYAEAKSRVKGMYDQLQIDTAAAPPIPATGLASETRTLLTKYPGAFARITDDPSTVSALKSLAKGTDQSQSVLLGANSAPMTPQFSFAEMRALDSDLGAMIRQGRLLNGRGEYNNKTFDQLVKVQKALRDDIEQWSTSIGSPKIAQDVAAANKAFREEVMPFRNDRRVRQVLQTEGYNPRNLAREMFPLDDPFTLGKSVSFLTPEGVQAGRFHMLNQAHKAAESERNLSGIDPLSYLKHSNLGESGPKLYSPAELAQLADTRELVRDARRAGEYSADATQGHFLGGLGTLLSPKLAGAFRGLTAVTQNPSLIRYSLADPRITGSAPRGGLAGLSQYAETGIRKGGTGLGLAQDPQLPRREEGNNSWK